VRYNFGCVIASDTLFDSRGWVFGAKLSDEDIHCSLFRGSKGHCHGNHFLAFYIWGAHWRHLDIRLNRPCAAAMRPYVKLLWPLVKFWFLHHWKFHAVSAFCSTEVPSGTYKISFISNPVIIPEIRQNLTKNYTQFLVSNLCTMKRMNGIPNLVHRFNVVSTRKMTIVVYILCSRKYGVKVV